MYCAYHFKGMIFDNSEYSPNSSKVYFNALKNLSVDLAKYRYARSLLLSRFNPFNVIFIQNLILLQIQSESSSLLSKVDLSFYFFCNKLANFFFIFFLKFIK